MARREPTDTVNVKVDRETHTRIKHLAIDMKCRVPEVIERAVTCLEEQREKEKGA
jgi:predicted transcriptional regulator